MTDILVDTSAYSAGAKGHQGVRTVMERAATISLNPAVLGELQAGFLRGSRRAENEETLQNFLAVPRVEELTCYRRLYKPADLLQARRMTG